MRKTIRTEKALEVYNILNQGKYTKMDDKDKINVWKICRALRPVAVKFEEDIKDASEKLKPSEEFSDALIKAQEYERLRNDKQQTIDIMTDAEYHDFIKILQTYRQTVGEAVKEFADKEVDVDFESVTEDAFGKLIASNEWTFAQVTTLGEFICE